MSFKEYNPEELKLLSNEILRSLLLSIRSKIFSSKDKQEKIDLEIYYCYIAREVERRIM